MKVVRGLLGVALGFGVFYAVVHMMSAYAGDYSDTAPENYLLLGVTVAVVAGIAGGYIAAWLAGEHEFPHASAVGLLMVGMSFLAMRQEGTAQPGWRPITIAGCGPISAMIGAAIRILTKAKPKSKAKPEGDQAENSNTSGAASRL